MSSVSPSLRHTAACSTIAQRSFGPPFKRSNFLYLCSLPPVSIYIILHVVFITGWSSFVTCTKTFVLFLIFIDVLIHFSSLTCAPFLVSHSNSHNQSFARFTYRPSLCSDSIQGTNLLTIFISFTTCIYFLTWTTWDKKIVFSSPNIGFYIIWSLLRLCFVLFSANFRLHIPIYGAPEYNNKNGPSRQCVGLAPFKRNFGPNFVWYFWFTAYVHVSARERRHGKMKTFSLSSSPTTPSFDSQSSYQTKQITPFRPTRPTSSVSWTRTNAKRVRAHVSIY